MSCERNFWYGTLVDRCYAAGGSIDLVVPPVQWGWVVIVARSKRWVWVGRGVFGVIVAGLVVYLVTVGLDKADKLGSTVGGVVAVVALVAPYLWPRAGGREDVVVSDEVGTDKVVVEDSGDAEAKGGGEANTGAETAPDDTGTVRVTKSGKAVANGPGSVANTGVRRVPRS